MLNEDICKEHEGQPAQLILQGMPAEFFKDSEVVVKILEGSKYSAQVIYNEDWIDKRYDLTEFLEQSRL